MLCSTKWEEIVARWLFTTHGSLSQLLFEPSPNFCELLLSIEGRWIMKRDLSCSDAHSPLSLFTPLCTALHGGSEWLKSAKNKFGEGSKSRWVRDPCVENSQPATNSSHFVEHCIAANVFFLSSTYIPHEQSMFDQTNWTNPRTTRIHLNGPELISRIFSSKIQQVHMIFVSSHIIFRNVWN